MDGDGEHDDIALLERAFLTLAQQFDAVRRGDLAPVTEFWDPGLRIENVDGWPVPGSYAGYDGFRQWFDETFGGFSAYQPTRADYTHVGDSIVACVQSRWRSVDGDSVIPQVALRFQIRDGRISRMDVFLDEQRALAAALT